MLRVVRHEETPQGVTVLTYSNGTVVRMSMQDDGRLNQELNGRWILGALHFYGSDSGGSSKIGLDPADEPDTDE